MTNPKSYEVATTMYSYKNYQENSITGRFIQHAQVNEFIQKLKNEELFEIKTAGYSFENRNLDLIKIGNGETKVLFWSQMHGDESTSTRAILDLLNFFKSTDDNKAIREKIFRHITLYIIPMLNPDGANKFKRRNAQLIDINRDAVDQQTPEGRMLYKIKNNIKPDWCFNLHDQSSSYSVGMTNKSSTISLLAPPFNQQLEVDEVREKAIKLIVSIYNELSEVIPGHIARYDDEFEPRAFGDNFAKDGSSTILIEAGEWSSDPEREYVRQLFFMTLIKALLSISERSYEDENPNKYFEIIENKERVFDLLLRNVTNVNSEKEYKVDIAIRRESVFDKSTSKIYQKGYITDIGDLSNFFGHEEYDLSNLKLELPKINLEKSITPIQLLKSGYLFTKSDDVLGKWTSDCMNYFNQSKIEPSIEIESPANFILQSENKAKYIVLNGYFIDPNKPLNFTGNGIIYP